MTRAHRSLWILTATTILAAGVLAQALAAPASITADVFVAAGALLLAGSAGLLIRVVRYLAKSSTRATPSADRSTDPKP